MADREKVIKGLECCIEWDSCNKCPYETPNEYDIAECTLSLHKDALALLKEQEVIKPFSDDDGAYWCGSCHEDMVWHQKFCSNCGRPVLWEGR